MYNIKKTCLQHLGANKTGFNFIFVHLYMHRKLFVRQCEKITYSNSGNFVILEKCEEKSISGFSWATFKLTEF